mgnify:CR=1 FL=1
MQTTCYTAHVTLRDGIPRRLSIQAASLEQARLTARICAKVLFRRQPFTFSVSAA